MNISKSAEPYYKWFSFGEEDFLIRHITKEDVKDLTDVQLATILFKDWRGVFDANGVAVPCTPEFIAEFMEVLEGRERYLWCLQKAMNLNSFVDFASMEKNSSRPSNGESTIPMQTAATAPNAKPKGEQARPAPPVQ